MNKEEKQLHWHFLVIGYQSIEGTNYHEAVEIEILEAKSEKEAIKIAKQTVKKNHYVIKKAWQCSQCFNFGEIIKLLKKIK